MFTGRRRQLEAQKLGEAVLSSSESSSRWDGCSRAEQRALLGWVLDGRKGERPQRRLEVAARLASSGPLFSKGDHWDTNMPHSY